MLNFSKHTDFTLGPLLATVLLGFASFLLLLWYSYRKQRYWKQFGIPYVTPIPLLGSVLDFVKKPLHEAELDRYRKYGRVYGHYESSRPCLSVGEPDLLRQILVKDFHAFTGRRIVDVGDKLVEKMVTAARGEYWKRIRTIISPTFSTGKIKKVLCIFKECSQTLVKNFKQASDKGEHIEVKSIYGAFTMDVIASSAFSTKIDSHNDPDNPFVQAAKLAFLKSNNWKMVIFLLMPFLLKIFKVSIFSKEAMKFFEEITLQIIEERKRTGQTRNDFLQLLLDTTKELSEEDKLDVPEKDDITENYGKEENHQFLKQTAYTKKTLTHEEVVAQCVIFFLAGYDTTASTLTFASYNLALNSDIQEKLIKELDDVLRENDGTLDYAAIQSMKYLDNVISETLRIFPPGIRLERRADENYNLEDAGLVITKGTIITVPVFAMHRDPELYPDPEKFDPDRFSPEERAKRNPYSYLPFGAGPRNCVAMRFALVEVKVCLAHVLSHFRFKKCPETKVPPDFFFGQGLLQPKNIKLILEPRTDTVTDTVK